MVANKTYESLFISIIEWKQADVITASGVTVTWSDTWGKNWDDYNVEEVWK